MLLSQGPQFNGKPSRRLHVMTKPIGPACNIDCKYCYYLHKENLYGNRERWKMNDEQLQSFLGEERFHLAQEQDEIVREVDQGRIGREFYPFLLVTLVITLALENLMSNRFYRNP